MRWELQIPPILTQIPLIVNHMWSINLEKVAKSYDSKGKIKGGQLIEVRGEVVVREAEIGYLIG